MWESNLGKTSDLLRFYHDSLPSIKERDALLDAWTDACVILYVPVCAYSSYWLWLVVHTLFL
jgi:hypothetical protein